jgi:DNA invertase Pin-like site-specific DNA recombinase
MPDTALRFIGLTRKSKGEDDGTHIEQRANIERRIASEPGLVLLRCTPEKGVSGGKVPWQKRELGQALEDIKAGLADGVIVDEVDRLTRERAGQAAAIWESFEAAKAVLLDCKGTDSRDEEGEFFFTLNAAIARKQYKQYQRRSDAGRGRAVMENNVHGGSIAPWGYEWTWREKDGRNMHGPLVPAKDNRVAEAFEDIIAGISHRSFHRKYGIQMGHVVGNRAFLGEAKSGEFVKENAHPPLVDEDTFRRANLRFPKADKGGGRPSKVVRPPALLPSDVIRCGNCGHGLSRQTNAKGDHYRCQFEDCDRAVSIGCNKADAYVLDAVLTWHAEDTALHMVRPGDALLLTVEKALESARADRDEVERMMADGELSPVAYAGARSAADAAVTAAAIELSHIEVEYGWRSMPTARVKEKIEGDAEATRSFVREFVRVHVAPGTRWTPITERIALSRVWKYVPEQVAEGLSTPVVMDVSGDPKHPVAWEDVPAEMGLGNLLRPHDTTVAS